MPSHDPWYNRQQATGNRQQDCLPPVQLRSSRYITVRGAAAALCARFSRPAQGLPLQMTVKKSHPALHFCQDSLLNHDLTSAIAHAEIAATGADLRIRLQNFSLITIAISLRNKT